MTRLVALLALLAVAAGCGDAVLSDQTLCHNMCAPGRVVTFVAPMGCHPTACTCGVAQPDGGR